MLKENLRRVLVGIGLIGFLFIFTHQATAQRKARARSAAKNSSSSGMVTEKRKGAEDVATQIKNLTKFLFVLGGVANGIEQIDKDVKAGLATREVRKSNEEFKSNVISSVRALRSGLVKLEIDFRTKPKLKPYLSKIEGIINDSARAEDLAVAGQFTNSGKQLLAIVETLTDVLVEMQ